MRHAAIIFKSLMFQVQTVAVPENLTIHLCLPIKVSFLRIAC